MVRDTFTSYSQIGTNTAQLFPHSDERYHFLCRLINAALSRSFSVHFAKSSPSLWNLGIGIKIFAETINVKELISLPYQR
jgi:hypothetical protein